MSTSQHMGLADRAEGHPLDSDDVCGAEQRLRHPTMPREAVRIRLGRALQVRGLQQNAGVVKNDHADIPVRDVETDEAHEG